ncbi:MAG: glycosyltransferase family 9 protein [Sneathiellaceae bacterium]
MKILFITHTRIGDAVLSTGLIEWLRGRYPGARFTIACGPACTGLFEGMPGVERVIGVPKRPWGGHWFGLWRAVAATRWSLIVDLRASLLSWCLLARRRRSFWVQPSAGHKLQQMGMLFRQLEPPAPRLYPGARHRAAAAAALDIDGPVLALAPTANWGGKVWPADRFVAAARQLAAPGGLLDGLGGVAVFGGPGEEEMARPVVDGLRQAGFQVADLCGRLDLLSAYAALQRCAFFIGNDSALMHMAAAAGIPTLGLFGPSREEQYRPWGPHGAAVRTALAYDAILRQPGYDYRRGDSHMGSLSVEAVVAAATALAATLDEQGWQPAEPAATAPS